MRILGADCLSEYAKRRPRKRESLLAFRALVETAGWRLTKDAEAQFPQVVSVTAPDRVAFDFPDEDLRIEMRINGGLALARILNVGPSVIRKEK